MKRMKVSVSPATRLDDEVTEWWTAAQAADPELGSPYFCPGFTAAVASVRNDVFVGVVRDGSRIVAVLPFQRNWWGAGRPVGGPVCDFQGIIAEHDLELDPRWLARGCAVRFWDFPNTLGWQRTFASNHVDVVESPYMDLSRGFEAYCDERRAAGSYQIRESHRKGRKLAREVGPLRFEYDAKDPRVMETLLLWKSKQYQATGKPDGLQGGWVRELLDLICDTKEQNFSGLVSALYAGDQLVAAHFGMRSRHVLHWWYPAYDADFGSYSPGLTLCLELAREAASHGISRIDLGYGDERYKLGFISGATRVARVAVDATVGARSLRNGWKGARSLVRATPFAAPARRALRPIRRWLSLD
jgi:CelD/BcsL family acetyltransferase involved in cellulose biosynthesis